MEWASTGVKGEIVLLIEGATRVGVARGGVARAGEHGLGAIHGGASWAAETNSSEETSSQMDAAVARVLKRIENGESRRDAVAAESISSGLIKRELYQASLAAKRDAK